MNGNDDQTLTLGQTQRLYRILANFPFSGSVSIAQAFPCHMPGDIDENGTVDFNGLLDALEDLSAIVATKVELGEQARQEADRLRAQRQAVRAFFKEP